MYKYMIQITDLTYPYCIAVKTEANKNVVTHKHIGGIGVKGGWACSPATFFREPTKKELKIMALLHNL